MLNNAALVLGRPLERVEAAACEGIRRGAAE
jgi:hypothetical protein